MSSLSNQQKQLLFDYCICLTSTEHDSQAQQLMSSNNEAAELYSKLKAALVPLDSLKPESCPDDLTESTVWRLTNAARSSQIRLKELLAVEQAKTVSVKNRFWANLGEMVAAAAVILIFSGVLIPPLRHARQNYWQKQCQMQLARMGRGISNYSHDHDGRLPAVAMANGAPWWKVGYQGNENHSNTRHLWLLVKGNYVNPADFVCPGRREGRAMQFNPAEMKRYNDFPARRYMTYSFRIRCNRAAAEIFPGARALIADMNPLFERLPHNYSVPLKLYLSKELSNLNSTNHNRRGQNILFCDGSVKFKKIRRIGIIEDDIFTLHNTQVYKGCEVPSCETDAFLAP